MSKAAALDFDSLDTMAASSKPHEFELVHPSTKKGLGVFLSVVGPEAPEFKARVSKETNRERRRNFEAQRKGRPAEPTTLEEDITFGTSLVADLVKGWRTVTDGESEAVIIWKGEKLPYSNENAIRWLSHFQWVVPQIDEFTKDIENFLGN